MQCKAIFRDLDVFLSDFTAYLHFCFPPDAWFSLQSNKVNCIKFPLYSLYKDIIWSTRVNVYARSLVWCNFDLKNLGLSETTIKWTSFSARTFTIHQACYIKSCLVATLDFRGKANLAKNASEMKDLAKSCNLMPIWLKSHEN